MKKYTLYRRFKIFFDIYGDSIESVNKDTLDAMLNAWTEKGELYNEGFQAGKKWGIEQKPPATSQEDCELFSLIHSYITVWLTMRINKQEKNDMRLLLNKIEKKLNIND